MGYNHTTRLTSTEMAGIWGQFIKDTGIRCVLSYFLACVEDNEIRNVIEIAFNDSEEHIVFLTDLFQQENIPVPTGFTEKDVKVDTPRLFSDSYFLLYLKNLSAVEMGAQTLAIGLGVRSDIIDFHEKLLNESVRLQEMLKEVLIKKGLYIRPPYITTPNKAEFITDQSFLGKYVGKQRPLTVIEISHLFLLIQTNLAAKEIFTAFAQVVYEKDVKQYFLRGKEISHKHINIYRKIFLDEDLPAPMIWDSPVTDSTVSPFSNQLMMFDVTAMSAAGIASYAAAMAASPRKDISLKYARLLTELSLFAEDGANIMIEHGWLEEPPQAPNRNKLVKE
jgi:hypothetical protein